MRMRVLGMCLRLHDDTRRRLFIARLFRYVYRYVYMLGVSAGERSCPSWNGMGYIILYYICDFEFIHIRILRT